MKYLLVNVPEKENLFKKTKIGLALPMMPPLSLASISSVILEEGHQVKVLDMRISECPLKDLKKDILTFSPDYLGLTFTTPLTKEAFKIVSFSKSTKPNLICISGGPHTSALPAETLKDSQIDIAVIGEGEQTIRDICKGMPLKKIKGIAYKEKGKIITNQRRELILDMDSLPLPSWHLFDLKKYHTPRISSKKNPVGPLETSRGCVYGCVYCSKCTFGRCFRMKSVNRVLEEIEFMLKYGFREIHIMDDMFSTDIQRAKRICEEIIRKKLIFPWTLINGIRVDRVDQELMIKLKKAGCYRIAFGVESGDDHVLKLINKGINVKQIKNAFKLAHKAGIETIAFCMVGLPGETKESMQKTIDLMKEVKPTLPKVSILLPLPNTPLFDSWDKKGLILTKKWEDYSFHSQIRVYKHPNLTNQEINKYYRKFWRDILFSPRYLINRLIRDLKTGELFYDIYYFMKSLRLGW